MTLRTRLTIGIGAIVAVMLVPLGISLLALRQVRRDTEQIRDEEFQGAVHLGRVRAAVEELNQTYRLLSIIVGDNMRVQFADRLQNVRLGLDSLNARSSIPGIGRVHTDLDVLDNASEQAHRLAVAGRSAAADSIIDDIVAPQLADMQRVMSIVEQTLQDRTRDKVNEIAAESRSAQLYAVSLLLVGALVAVLIAVGLTRSVSAPIAELAQGMRAVSQGDFGHPLNISSTRRDEFGRLAESYRLMANQLRELDILKAEFISVASHELKTPINVIMGYLQLLQDGVYGDLAGRQRDITVTLAAQARTLSRLVRQLLDVSRFEAGGGKVEPRNMALPAFLGDLERAFRVLAIQREVSFSVAQGPDLPVEVSWDPERMNEVLGNLLSNAFKFTSKGGRVSLEVERSDDHVRMRIADTGAGIPAAQLPYVFEKFYTADNQTTGIKGTGLGLAITKGIVTEHGGSISVQSTVGVGTTFTLLLPVRAPIPSDLREPVRAAG